MSSDLRSSLHAAADSSSVGGPDMNAARRRGHQLTTRRRALVATVALPVAAAAALVAFQLPSNDRAQGPVVPGGSTATSPATTTPIPDASPLADGAMLVYLREVSPESIVFDEVRWAGDGCDADVDLNQAEGAYLRDLEAACVVKQPNRLRQAPVERSTTVVLEQSPGGELEAGDFDWALDKIHADPYAAHYALWIQIENGQVVRIYAGSKPAFADEGSS